MADKKITALTEVTTLTSDDLFVIVSDPGGTSVTSKISAGNAAGWIAVRDTWAYASASTITIPSDGTTKYPRCCKIRFKQGGGYKYFVAVTVASTLITVLVNSDYTVANAAITDIAYSLCSPLDFPGFFNFTTTWGGFFANPATYDAKIMVAGCVATCYMRMDNGTSDATTFTFTLPIAPAFLAYPTVGVIDNSADQPAGFFSIVAGSTTVNVYKSAFAAFTPGNLKRFNAVVFQFLV